MPVNYIHRAEWGAAPPNKGPGPLDPSQVEGIAFHWPGMARPLQSRDEVARALRGWQTLHMRTNGWSDIAYQEAVDQDGNVYELRGLRTQSGANGDEDVNRRFGAILLVLAIGEDPSRALIDATRARVEHHRDLFHRSTRIVGHGQIRPDPTECPGPAVRELIARGVFVGDLDPRPTRVERGRALIGRGIETLQLIPDEQRPEVAGLVDKIDRLYRNLPRK